MAISVHRFEHQKNNSLDCRQPNEVVRLNRRLAMSGSITIRRHASSMDNGHGSEACDGEICAMAGECEVAGNTESRTSSIQATPAHAPLPLLCSVVTFSVMTTVIRRLFVNTLLSLNLSRDHDNIRIAITSCARKHGLSPFKLPAWIP